MQLRFSQLLRYQDPLLDGLARTAELTLVCVCAGLAIGLVCAFLYKDGHRAFRRAIYLYVEFFRNTPSLIQLFVFFFLLPDLGLLLSPFAAASIALSLYFGAYATEIVRSGLDSIPAAQTEAGACLGLTRYQIYKNIVIAPAIRNVYQSLSAQVVILLLGTSLASQISVHELFHVATFIESRTYLSFEVYAVLCAVYFLLVLVFKVAMALLGRFLFRWPTGRKS
jgi:polar amino acid transport system permease protein